MPFNDILAEPFEEASVPQLLQYMNKFDAPIVGSVKPSASGTSTPDAENVPSRVATPQPGQAVAAAIIPRPNQDKIAVALALLVTGGLCNSSVLSSLKKDHLVKDGEPRASFFKLSFDSPQAHLCISLRRMQGPICRERHLMCVAALNGELKPCLLAAALCRISSQRWRVRHFRILACQ